MSDASHKKILAKEVLAPIVEHQEIALGYWRMKISAPHVATAARAGHFIHLLPRQEDSTDPLLRRAFSILNVEEECFEILYRVGGKGTRSITGFRVGDVVNIIAPLGKPFEDNGQPAILVGGGVGVPPMAMLARQRYVENPGSQTTVIVGGQSGNDILCTDDFRKCKIEPLVTTVDGSAGRKGFVTLWLRELLESREKHSVYACGPWPMLHAVAALCREFDVPCQVSMEENMPCGVGVCNGCVVKMLEGDNEYSMYRRICTEGPVVWAHEVDWDC